MLYDVFASIAGRVTIISRTAILSLLHYTCLMKQSIALCFDVVSEHQISRLDLQPLQRYGIKFMDVLGRMTEPHIVSAQATPAPKMSQLMIFYDGETSRT
jgi:hypothetical protein